MKRVSPSSVSESDEFLLSLVLALAREAAKRDHDAAGLGEGPPP
jgi:hypothetical protein